MSRNPGSSAVAPSEMLGLAIPWQRIASLWRGAVWATSFGLVLALNLWVRLEVVQLTKGLESQASLQTTWEQKNEQLRLEIETRSGTRRLETVSSELDLKAAPVREIPRP